MGFIWYWKCKQSISINSIRDNLRNNFKCIASDIGEETTGTRDTNTYGYGKHIVLFGKTDLFFVFLESSYIEYGSQVSNITDYGISELNGKPDKVIVFDTFLDLVYGVCVCLGKIKITS